MNTATGIHWLRVLLGGFLAEVSLIALVIPVSLLFGKQTVPYIALLGSLLTCFVFAVWVGRRIDSRFVLHGILVGVVATLIYVALTRGGPEPLVYLVAHALKILGGAAGGFVAARRRTAMSAATSTAQ
jgi:putative membrane protein (TIGR04086 family)